MLYYEAVEAFKKYLTMTDHSQETIRGYSIELTTFGKFLEGAYNGPVYLSEVSVADMEDYLHYLKTKGDAAASRSRVVYILRSFYTFADKKDLVEKNLAAKLEPPKVPQKERNFLNESEFQELVGAIESEIIKSVAWTLYLTGLRISEALKLTLGDVDMINRVIHVRNGKGAKDRVIPISDRLQGILINYLSNVRPEVTTDNFFATKKTGKLAASTVNRALSEAVASLGWTKEVTCHVLRHSFASHLIKNNVNLVQVQRLLGHANLAVTSRYTHTDLNQLAKAVNTF